MNFRRRMPQLTFQVHMDNSICHNGSKVVSKLEKHHLSRLPHPPHSPEVSLSGFWLSGVLKVILEDREFNSNDETEEVIASAWNDFAFDRTRFGVSRQ
jgi:hypothetical protein